MCIVISHSEEYPFKIQIHVHIYYQPIVNLLYIHQYFIWGVNPIKQIWLKLHQNWCSKAEIHWDWHQFWGYLVQSSFMGLTPVQPMQLGLSDILKDFSWKKAFLVFDCCKQSLNQLLLTSTHLSIHPSIHPLRTRLFMGLIQNPLLS